MTPSTHTNTQTLYDGYGRISRVAIGNSQSSNPYYQTDYCYDFNGRLQFQSYQYQGNGWATPQVCSGAGDAYSYDPLGRVTQMLHGDGTSANYQYTGPATEVTNENGAQRISQVDGLGRLTAACEISSNGSMPSSGSPASCGLDIAGTGFLTNYAYNLAVHESTVTQGAQTRIFQTDSLGRPILVQEPESGQTSYSYAYNGTGLVVTRTRPQANQTNPSTLTTTTTQYDSLGRVVSINYSDGTPNKSFAYDQSTIWGGSLSTGAALGRMTTASTSNPWAGQAFAYDLMGRIVLNIQCLPYWCGTSSLDKYTNYTYDYLGDMTSVQDSAGITTSYSYSPAQEVIWINSSINDATHPGTLVSNVTNGPDGPVSWSLGNGLTGVNMYDTLGNHNGSWVCDNGSVQDYCGGSGQVYGWVTGASAAGTQLSESWDTVEGYWVYGYDEFNRLASSNLNSGQQAFSWTYDRYGNRWAQNVTAGSGSQFSASFNVANNEAVGYTYDAAGNLTNDGSHSYQYDAEGNIVSVDGGSTATYIYDALNRRVQTYVGGNYAQFVFNLSGQRTTTWAGDGHELAGYSYWGSAPLEFYAGDAAHFEHQDWVGTERIHTSYNGSSEGTFTSLPFGDGSSMAGGNDQYFAGLDADGESTTYHAQFRQYTPAEGRWMSPDPYAGSYDFTNPQSLNRYSYVLNNPLSSTDPSGLDSGNCEFANSAADENSGMFGTPTLTVNQINYGGLDQSDCEAEGGNWLGADATNTYIFSVNVWANGPPGPSLGPFMSSMMMGAYSQLEQREAPAQIGSASQTTRIGARSKVNWFANSNCQYAYLNSKYGPGTSSFVSRFSLLSYTPLASGPSANASETMVPTIGTEGTKVGVGYLLKLRGASGESLSAWGAMTLIPTLMGTAYDAEAKYACKDVTGINPQGW